MKNRLKYLWLLFFIIGGNYHAYTQSYNVINTDTSSFPQLKVKLQLLGVDNAFKEDFKVFDEKDPTQPVSIDLKTPEKKDSSNANKKKNRLIFFLIDASAEMSGVPVNSVKRSLMNSLGVLTPEDKINIGYFTDTDETSMLSPGFTNNLGFFRGLMEKIVAPPRDTTDSHTSKVYASIYKILQKINDEDADGQKILVILSAGKNKGSAYTSTDCINRAKQMRIPVYTITYQLDNQPPDGLSRISSEVNFKSMPQGSKSRVVKTSGEIQNAIGDFFSIREQVITNQGILVDLSFDTDVAADGNQHSFEIRYKNESKMVRYFAPLRAETGGNFFRKYGLYLVIAAGALLGVLVWLVHSRNVKRAEEERIAEEEEAEAEEQARIAAEAARQRQQDALARQQQEEASRQNEATDQRLKALEEQNIRLQEQIRSQQLNAQNQPTPDPKFDMKRTIISGGGGAPTLMVSAGAFNQTFPLNKPKVIIGRAQENDIMIPIQTVSGHHASITIEGGSFYLTDLGSTNGTFVNGSRVNKAILKSGDMIKLGAANLKFHI